MAKIYYQYLIPLDIHEYLMKKHKQFRHKNLSQTINYLLWQIKGLEQSSKSQEEKKQEPTQSNVIGDLEKKYGIDKHD